MCQLIILHFKAKGNCRYYSADFHGSRHLQRCLLDVNVVQWLLLWCLSGAMKHCQICSEGHNTSHGHFTFMHVEFDNAFRFVEDEVWPDMKATAVGNERDKQQLTKLIPTEFF